MRVICLHGFLGHPTDWDFLRAAGFAIDAPNLFHSPVAPSMEAWARTFVATATTDDILLGYSMGGRLALHALFEKPFRAAVIVSAGLGLESEQDRAARRTRDESWAGRFEHDDWATVIREWNAQPIFGGAETLRLESSYDRQALAAALRQWSPAAHAPLTSRLGGIETPVLWIAGARDTKYVDVARRAVSQLPHGELWVCPDSAHRVPWEQPARFLDKLSDYVEKHS